MQRFLQAAESSEAPEGFENPEDTQQHIELVGQDCIVLAAFKQMHLKILVKILCLIIFNTMGLNFKFSSKLSASLR